MTLTLHPQLPADDGMHLLVEPTNSALVESNKVVS